MTYEVGEELAQYLLLNGYKELIGDDYLKHYEFNRYNPRRRRLFYIPRTKTGKFTMKNWRYIEFDWDTIKDWETQYFELSITKEKLDEIIKIQKSK